MKVEEIQTVSDFEKKVVDSGEKVVVDFFATWCAPCRVVAPIMEELAALYNGKVKFYKVDVDKLMDLAVKYRITGVPTILMFKDGKEVGRTIGAASRDSFVEKINANLLP